MTGLFLFLAIVLASGLSSQNRYVRLASVFLTSASLLISFVLAWRTGSKK